MLEDRLTRSESKVPILGDIPFLGRLFRGSSETSRKQNLMVFIKPTILDESEKIYQETAERYETIREKQTGEDSAEDIVELPDFETLRTGKTYDLRPDDSLPEGDWKTSPQ